MEAVQPVCPGPETTSLHRRGDGQDTKPRLHLEITADICPGVPESHDPRLLDCVCVAVGNAANEALAPKRANQCSCSP